MKVESQYLHSGMTQNESVDEASGLHDFFIKNRQKALVTFRGSRLEKSSGRLFEVICISMFLLSFLLVGCSPAMRDPGAGSHGDAKVLEFSGEATMPPSANILDGKLPTAPGDVTASTTGQVTGQMPSQTTGMTPAALMSFIDQEAVGERVRLVIGWLRFVRQTRAMAMVQTGWDRVQSRQIIEPLDNSAVLGRSDLSISELMMWRQILKADGVVLNAAQAGRLENLAVLLAYASNPDDLLKVDDLLVEPDTVAGY